LSTVTRVGGLFGAFATKNLLDHIALPGGSILRAARAGRWRRATGLAVIEPAAAVEGRMVKLGDRAPDFSAPCSTGGTVTLTDYCGQLVVLYFFLRIHWTARGCIQETRRFRDNYPELRALGAEVIGVSTDRYDATCKFALENQVTFPMVGDEDRSISRAYGVLRPILPLDRRVTFVLDEQQVVRAVFRHEFQVSRHLDDVLAFVRRRHQITTAAR
jgi:peroxiredoxin Q/BCP